MAQRNERMEFPYGAPQPGMPPQHHPGAVQPPMGVQTANASSSAQATPTQTPAQPGRQRKRPAPSAGPPPPTGPPAPATPVQPQSQVPAPGSAPPPVVAQGTPAAGDDAIATPSSAPPAKKSRTNTPWTPQEELRLKQMRDAGNSWAEIAKVGFVLQQDGPDKELTAFLDIPEPDGGIGEEALVQGWFRDCIEKSVERP